MHFKLKTIDQITEKFAHTVQTTTLQLRGCPKGISKAGPFRRHWYLVTLREGATNLGGRSRPLLPTSRILPDKGQKCQFVTFFKNILILIKSRPTSWIENSTAFLGYIVIENFPLLLPNNVNNRLLDEINQQTLTI